MIKGNDVLLSYETKTDLWVTPGGGVEDGESLAACCIMMEKLGGKRWSFGMLMM